MPTKPKAKRQRPHGLLPAGFVWRDGRPRWIPSPTRRKQGWRAVDLRDAWGKFLPKGEAVARAEAIAAAVAAWADGKPVPAPFVHLAPKGAELKGATASTLNPRSIGALLDAYYESAKFTTKLAAATQADYRNKLRRFLEVVASDYREPADAKARDRLPRQVEALKALEVDALLPPAFGEDGLFAIEEAYEFLRDNVGPSMAAGVHACVSAWLGWCVKKRRVWPSNPAQLVERTTPDGRIRVATIAELRALVAAAEALGWPSIADAIVLAVDLSWSPADLRSLTWGQIADTGHVRHRRIKTGVAGNPRLLGIGQARLALIRARLGENVEPAAERAVIVYEGTGQPYAASLLTHKFVEVRTLAAKTCPSVADFQFRDLRDTAITYALEAGLSVPGICSRCLLTPKRAEDVIFKHYGAIRQGLSDAAALQLDAHFNAEGYTFDAPKALPAPKP